MLSCMIRPSQAQSIIPSVKGEIRGKVTDVKTKKPLDYVSITILNSRNKVVAQVLSDDDGNYIVKQLDPGEYEVKVTNLGYLNLIVDKVKVEADYIIFVNLPMSPDKNGRAIGYGMCCGCFRRSTENKIDKSPALLSLQSQYALQKNESFNCVMQHKSREVEQQLKESSVKLFNEVRSFPSPTHLIINIESMYDGVKEIMIRNLSGLEVYHGTIIHHLQLEVAAFPLGLYVITVIDKNNDEKNYSKFVVAY